MQIQKISISNILGIQDLQFEAGQFTSIEGRNGQGKTSVLESIKAVLKTGHDATLLRHGEEKGEIVLVLDDGQSILKKVGADSSTTEIRDANGKKVARPAEALKAITDMLSVNPIDFLNAPKKDRVRVLLEAMPLEVDAEKLSEIAGIEVTAQPGVHALQVISSTHKIVYDERTGTNRAVSEKKSTINQLRNALPEMPEGVEGDEDTLVAKINEATTARDTKLGKIRDKMDGIKTAAQKSIDDLRTKLQADIDKLKADAQVQVDAIQADVAENQAKANTATDATKATWQQTVEPLLAAQAIIRNNREAVGKRKQTLETIEQMESDLELLEEVAKSQTQALADIEQYKSDLLNDLPIPGLEVTDGEIMRNGVHFDRLNTAQQVEIAVEIAKLRAGELGVVCVDGLELLDSAKFEAFRESAIASGLQLFVTRVGDNDLTIDTQN